MKISQQYALWTLTDTHVHKTKHFNAQNKVLKATIYERHVAEIVVCPLFVQCDLM